MNHSSGLLNSDLGLDELARQLHTFHGCGLDDGDIFLQRTCAESWALSESKVKDTSYHQVAGLGVRAMVGEKTGFAYADGLNSEQLQMACQAARAIARHGQHTQIHLTPQHIQVPSRYQALNPLEQWSADEKVQCLQMADAYARQLDVGVVDVSASLSASYEEIVVMRLDGQFATDIRPLVRFGIQVVIERNGRRESGSSGGGGRDGYNQFCDQDTIRRHVEDAVHQAQLNFEAIAAPAGQMPVVLGSGWPGILLHEAVGHGLEGDFNRKGTSVFSGKIGERVCSPLCTVIDDGTLYAGRGSLSVDDEGTPSAHNILIENGILRGYLQDRLNARLMGTAPTGNGRRESYAHLPMPRMTNTYLAAGQHHKDEMIKSVKRGLYAEQFGGGQVDITNGQFVFAATQAYLIEDGKITAPVKGATLIGNGLAAMQAISMVGDDLAFDRGVGTCGKQGQSVPVGVGQPSVKIDQITVGGTAL